MVTGGLYGFGCGCCSDSGMQKRSEPWLDGRMGEGSAGVRCLAPLTERGQGQRGQKGEAVL